MYFAIFLYMLREVGNQNIVGCLQQFTLIFSLYQIWLSFIWIIIILVTHKIDKKTFVTKTWVGFP
jgi:hypothetical protein